MAFAVDHSQASEGTDLLPEGEYEVIIKYAGESATKSGTVYINVTCVIRNDIEQKFKNKYVWYSIWHKKEPTQADLSCSGYSSKQIQNLSKAVKLPDGKEYENVADWCDDLKNHVFKVTIEHEEYKGKTQAKVKWTDETKYPECHHIWKKAGDETPAANETASANTPAAGEYVEVTSDDDLPF